MSINLQPAEKPAQMGPGRIEVIDVWYTVQGEGPDSGTPAAFVRTAGCNLRCPLCDTQYTAGRRVRMTEEVADEALNAYRSQTHVWPIRGRDQALCVISGGEPFRQDTLGELVRALVRRDFRVQIETNGTLYQDDLPWYGPLSIVCSPKAGAVHSGLKPYVTALKYVLEAGAVDPADGLPTSVLGNGVSPCRPWPGFKGQVFVQPADASGADEVTHGEAAEKSLTNLRAAVDSCKRFGYRLSLQTHKFIGEK